MSPAGKRILAISLVATFSIATAIVAARAQAPAAPAQASPGSVRLAEQQFKNIKVLKGIPADEVIPAMEFITASLGVECEFCHVRQEHGLAFDKDEKKPKEIARKMIEMAMAINKDNFEGKREVTCYSCHRGAAHPVGTPLVAVEGEKPPEHDHDKKPDAAALPSADQLFEKYLSASGGAAAINKITSRVEKGTISGFGDQHFGIDIVAKAPDMRS
jgi:photosynthetic reaction center cytochrome c subunit